MSEGGCSARCGDSDTDKGEVSTMILCPQTFSFKNVETNDCEAPALSSAIICTERCSWENEE